MPSSGISPNVCSYTFDVCMILLHVQSFFGNLIMPVVKTALHNIPNRCHYLSTMAGIALNFLWESVRFWERFNNGLVNGWMVPGLCFFLTCSILCVASTSMALIGTFVRLTSKCSISTQTHGKYKWYLVLILYSTSTVQDINLYRYPHICDRFLLSPPWIPKPQITTNPIITVLRHCANLSC